MQIAETGDIIEFKGGMQGRVQKRKSKLCYCGYNNYGEF